MESNKIPVALRTRGKILERFYAQHPEKLLRRKFNKEELAQNSADDSSHTQRDVLSISSEDDSDDYLTSDDSEYTGDKSTSSVTQSDVHSDSSSSSSDDDDEVEHHGNGKRRKTEYEQVKKDGCFVSNTEKIILGCSSAKPVLLESESEDSGLPSSRLSSASDNDEYLNHKHRPRSSQSKRGRKKRKLQRESNPGSVSKQRNSEYIRSNRSVSVPEMEFSSMSSREGDKEDNGAGDPEDNGVVSMKRAKKPKLNLDEPRGGDQEDNGVVPKKRGRKPNLHERSSPFSVSTHKIREVEHHGVDARKGPNGKRKGQGSRNGRQFINILNETIMADGDETLFPPEEASSTVESTVENTLPMKFRFEYEDPIPVEKTEYAIELDGLFAGLEMGLIENEIGTSNVQMKEDDAVDVDKLTPAERCRLGHHVAIFDETVGKICKHCDIVLEEIHDTLPDLVTLTGRKRDRWFAIRKKKGLFFGSLDFDESAIENRSAVENHTGPVIDLIPDDLRNRMHVHQKEGYKFLWKNLGGAELIEDVKTPLQDGGTGSIISHAPGTGKTFLTIVFLKTFLDVYPDCQPMIVAPQSMLLTWEAQFKKWGVNIPFHNLNDGVWSDTEKEMATSFCGDLGTSTDREKRTVLRMIRLHSWITGKDRGVLGVGYQLFEKLAHDRKDAEFRKILLEKPGLVVFDEGHTARNKSSLLYKVLTQLKTTRRVVLSGTPFQNNPKELRNVLQLVKPDFDSYLNDHQRMPSSRDKGIKGKESVFDSLTKSLGKNSVFGTEMDLEDIKKVKSMLSPIVHVYEGDILEKLLPGLKDTLIVLKPTDEQQKLLQKIKPLKLKHFKKLPIESHVSIHPSVLLAQNELFQDDRAWLEKMKHNHLAGVKTKILIEIIRLSMANKEKVLVFSLYLPPLKFILELLMSCFPWTKGNQVLCMEGKDDMRDRQAMMDRFNNANDESIVLLASSKACSEGINLVGASRVVLLGVEWNPSIERQAICRAYRIGQTKVVHVYRLIMSGISDMKKFKRQTRKYDLSKMIFSSKEVDNQNVEAPEDMVLDAIVQHPSLRDSFERILHEPKEALHTLNLLKF